MTAEETKQYKAKNLRYKKPILSGMNLGYIYNRIDEMRDAIYEVQWFTDNTDNLTNALDGDEDEAYQFRLAFSDLMAELDEFEADLRDEYVPECFDDLFPAVNAQGLGDLYGYDSYEDDYFHLDPYEYGWAQKEAEKRILRMTKQELLDAVGACLKVFASFVALEYRYDCLEASLNIIREKNLEGLKLVKAIEEQYDKVEAESEHFKWRYGEEYRKLDDMLLNVPQVYWVQ